MGGFIEFWCRCILKGFALFVQRTDAAAIRRMSMNGRLDPIFQSALLQCAASSFQIVSDDSIIPVMQEAPKDFLLK